MPVFLIKTRWSMRDCRGSDARLERVRPQRLSPGHRGYRRGQRAASAPEVHIWAGPRPQSACPSGGIIINGPVTHAVQGRPACLTDVVGLLSLPMDQGYPRVIHSAGGPPRGRSGGTALAAMLHAVPQAAGPDYCGAILCRVSIYSCARRPLLVCGEQAPRTIRI